MQIADDPYTHFLNAVWINPFTPWKGDIRNDI